MIADREGFLDDFVLRRRYILIVRESEQKSLFRRDVAAFGVRLPPWRVAETTAYFAASSLIEKT